MISEFDILSEKINQLAEMAHVLRRENADLRLKNAELKLENQQLADRMSGAYERCHPDSGIARTIDEEVAECSA